MKHTSLAMLLLTSCLAPTAFGDKPTIETAAVDPLIKVFPDTLPSGRAKATADVARGEHASLQVIVRSSQDLSALRATATPLTRRGAEAALEAIAPRFVGYVPVDRPIQSPPKDQLRKPPADFPDPLLEVATVDVPAGRTQAIWITVPIPLDAAPGRYRGELSLNAAAGGETVSATHPLAFKVYKATVPSTRLWVTDWFGVNTRHLSIQPKAESDEYYALLRRYARNLAEHRHNVAIISPLSLATFTAGQGGGLEIDFSRFDRWVEIFVEEGVIGRIEGGHLGGRKGEWLSDFGVSVREVKDGKVVASRVDPSSEAAETFYAQFLPALVTHLREKGWLEGYMQHLADEPIPKNMVSYQIIAGLVRKYAPELRIVEACHTKDLVGAMDIWVPQLNYLDKDFEHYQERQRAGDEVWFYTCVFPQGEYANRFIEQPLIKTRLLHWINYRYGATGYLHWGYNHWTADSPFTHTTRPHGGPPYLPAGDPWIVYPGTDGPLDSIRFEAMRDGIVDHELLSMLGEKDPKSAQKLAAKHILDFAQYNTDVKAFRKTRRKLLSSVSRAF